MKSHPRIALIHATRVAIDPIEAAAKEIWPQAEIISILEEALSVDRAASAELSDALHDRIGGLARYAQQMQSDGILFTCSAFGPAIEAAADEMNIPVMKPNEAMFSVAFDHGDRAALIYTFEPAAASMVQEFEEAAEVLGRTASITPIFCEGALEAKRDGDVERHDQLVADAAAGIVNADVILLAQFSMVSAAPLARQKTAIPVLTSPDAAIREMRIRVEAQK